MDIGIVILAVSALCAGAILAGAAGQKIDAPLLLVFLLAGMLAGREGPGGIAIDADQTVLIWTSAALAAILFEGGLRTKPSIFKEGLKPGISLAVVGTLTTAFLIAPFAHWAFGLDWRASLLVGAIVSSTDAAAVFALAATGLKLPKKVAAALEVESGFNDPLAIFLVLGLSTSIAIEPLTTSDWIISLVTKVGIGTLVGGAFGYCAPILLSRLHLPSGLMAILMAALGFMSFGMAETLGGSGFLAIYLAGVTIAMRAPSRAQQAGAVLDGIAWLSQTSLFLVLGLLITPSHLSSVALPALGVSLALIFLARPIATVLSLAAFKYRIRDMTFVAWTGLRGATPVFLGLLPAALGVPNGNLYLSAAAVIVLLSLVIQGWTAPVVGRALKLNEGDDAPMDRGETFARFGAVGASIAVGAWFSFSLAPSSSLESPTTNTIASLQHALENAETIPTAFPAEFSNLPPVEKKSLFIHTLRDVLNRMNTEIELDRAQLRTLLERLKSRGRLTLAEESSVSTIAKKYNLPFNLPNKLLQQIDIVPVDIAIAQAALATGWGNSNSAVVQNAVFGRDTQSGYDSLLDAAYGLAALYASHPEFEPFRHERTKIRTEGKVPNAPKLIPFLGPFAADGAAYIEQVSAVVQSLETAPQ